MQRFGVKTNGRLRSEGAAAEASDPDPDPELNYPPGWLSGQ